MNQRGFTLAEVLITLAIIGVVAAMTIPTLIADYQEKQTVSRLTKAYAVISNAYQMARVANGDLSSWGLTNSTVVIEDGETTYPSGLKSNQLFYDKLAPFLKVIKRTTSESISEYNVYTLDQREIKSGMPSDILLLADGTAIFGGWINDFKCADREGYCGDFAVDINGLDNPPNTFGRDLFSFEIYKNGIRPTGTKDTPIDTRTFAYSCKMKDSSLAQNGYGCTAWVIYNKNMDYLKCRDELSWDGKHSCD